MLTHAQTRWPGPGPRHAPLPRGWPEIHCCNARAVGPSERRFSPQPATVADALAAHTPDDAGRRGNGSGLCAKLQERARWPTRNRGGGPGDGAGGHDAAGHACASGPRSWRRGIFRPGPRSESTSRHSSSAGTKTPPPSSGPRSPTASSVITGACLPGSHMRHTSWSDGKLHIPSSHHSIGNDDPGREYSRY
jgi:hypothetical protein